MATIDDALTALKDVQREFTEFCKQHGRITEADTRIKVIDRVLKDVCGWPEASIEREQHNARGYTDYILSLPTRRALVVEAKAEGVSFVLPQVQACDRVLWKGRAP